MKTSYVAAAIVLSALITFALRVFPFFAFSGARTMPRWVERLGQTLPGAIMAVLLVYCLRDVGADWLKIGLPKLLGVAATAASYKLKSNMMLSIVVGTLVYMVLIRLI